MGLPASLLAGSPPPSPVRKGRAVQRDVPRKVIQLSEGESRRLAEKQNGEHILALSQNEVNTSPFDDFAAPPVLSARARGKEPASGEVSRRGTGVSLHEPGPSGLHSRAGPSAVPSQTPRRGWETVLRESTDLVSRVFRPSGKHSPRTSLIATSASQQFSVAEEAFPDSEAPITRGELVKLLQSVTERAEQRAELLVKAAQENVAPLPPNVSKGRTLPKVRAPGSWSNVRSSGDILVFLERVGTYLATGADLQEEERVNIAASLLEGEALEFWISVRPGLADDPKDITFEMFSEVLLGQYQPAFRQETAAADLLSLRERQGKFDEYRRKFDLLKAKLPFSPKEGLECLLVAMFRKGLHPSTADLVLLDPATGSKHANLRDLQQQAKVAADSVSEKLRTAPEPKQREMAPPAAHRSSQKKGGKGRGREEAKGGSGRDKGGPRCFRCNRHGHLSSQCPAKSAGKQLPPPPPGKDRKWDQGKGHPRR